MHVHAVFVFNLFNIVTQKLWEKTFHVLQLFISLVNKSVKQYEVTTLRHYV